MTEPSNNSVWTADIGGTAIKLGIYAEGRITHRDRIEVTDRRRLEPYLALMAQAWRAMSADLAVPSAVALCFPGIVDARSGRVLSTNDKFDDAPKLDLPAWAREEIGCGLWLENDARSACLAEWRAGAGRGCDSMVMMTLGTGIGTSAVIEGNLLRGRHGLAGILGGHLTVDMNGPTCTCGNIGCGEVLASTHHLAALVERCAQTVPDADNSALYSLGEPSYEAVASAADRGDALAVAVAETSMRVWGAVLVSLVHAYDPQRVVLGGGIGHRWEALVPGLQAYIDKHAWTAGRAVPLVRSELGDDAGMIGAAQLVALGP